MNQLEAASIITYLNRAGLVRAMEGAAAVWADALASVRYEDAQQAARNLVRDEAGEGRYATPGTLRREVRRIRAARVGNAVPPAPPPGIDPDDTAAQIAFQRAFLAALGDGADHPAADAAACRQAGVTRPAAGTRSIGDLPRIGKEVDA